MENSDASTNKKNKLIVVINIFMLIMSMVCLGFIVTMLILGDPTNRLLSCIFTFLLYFIPVFMQLFFKVRISFSLLIIYVGFVTLGAFCGSSLHLTHKLNGFDKVQHTIWGYVSCFIGLFYLCKTKEIDNVKPLTVILVFLGISLATSGIWEVFEFIGDKFLGQTAQGNPVNGIVAVDDAMYDIICHTCGSILFTVHYCLDKFLNKNLGITSVIRDFKAD